MLTPNFARLKQEHDKKGFHAYSSATFMHPNPKIYKYYWWVFWKNSPCDGNAFLDKKNRLPTKKAFDLINKLVVDGESYWLYNCRLPRIDPANSPLNRHANKWKNIEWAKSFADDTDEEYKGQK